MKDQSKTKRVLIQELASLRQRISELERSESERKNVEQELFLLKNLIFEASITANSVADIQGILTHANSSFIRTWGYENKEEVIGKPISDFLKFEHETRKIITALNENNEWAGEYTALRRDGTTFNAYAQATIVIDESGNTIGYQSTVLDITERKHMEAALRESEEHYRLLFENSPVGIFVYDTRLRFVNCNDRYLTMLRTTRDRIIGLDIAMLKDPIALPVFQLPLEGKCGSYEGPYHTTTSDIVIWISVYTAPLLNGERRIVGGIGIQEDITERKRAEEAQRRTEENFRRSLDESPLGMRIVTVEGETIYANRAILDIYGYDSVEELKNTPAEKRYSPESYVEFQTRREQRRHGFEDPSEYVISILRKDGGVRHLQVFRKEVLWDGERQFQALYHDISERKKAEEALRQSEEKYRDIFNKTVEGIYRTTPAGRFFTVNPAFARICGYASPEEMREKVTDVANQLYANPEDRLQFQKLIAAEGEVKGFKAQFKHPTKGLVWISINSKALRDEQGNIQYYDGTIEDITDRKRAGEKLIASQKQLRDIAERQQRVREEERIMIAREIHDELGGGLAGLKMALSWLLTNIYNNVETGKERTALMNKIHLSSELIDQLILIVRRIATDLRPSLLDDLGLIAALEWQLQEFTSRTEIQHEFVTALDYVNLEETTATAVFRIFQEALTNVLRHSRATKVVVVLQEGERSLFGDENLVLEIRDNGKGITDEEILNPKSLGLLGVKERVLAFGGELSVCGEPGEGTALILKIPRIQGEPS